MRTLIFLLLCINVCNSQTACFDIVFEGYNISSVTDDNQFIWAGTFDNGLISINKTTNDIQTYTTTNSDISSNSIRSVLNIDGRLYVSSDTSLMQYSNGNFAEISTTIQGVMAMTPDGNLAVAAPYAFNILDPNNQIIYTKDLLTLVSDSCCGFCTSIDYDDNGKLLLSNYGFYRYDILTYDSINWNVYNTANSILPVESFTFLNGITTHNNIVFVSNWVGLYKFENNAWVSEHSQDNLSIYNDIDNIEGLNVNALQYDSQGVLWIGAGEYDNIGNGKIAFKTQYNWTFLDNDSQVLPGINFFEASQNDSGIMYAASNNGLIIMDTNCVFASLEVPEQEFDNVSIFPNPTNGILNINIKEQENVSYQITNLIGQIIFSGTISKYEKIDMSLYSEGIYNIIFTIDNIPVSKKIIKVDYN